MEFYDNYKECGAKNEKEQMRICCLKQRAFNYDKFCKHFVSTDGLLWVDLRSFGKFKNELGHVFDASYVGFVNK